MSLLLNHPEVAYRACSECRKWMFDPKTGRLCGPPGQPIPRPAHSHPPCRFCPKCEGSEEKSPEEGTRNTLSRKNWRALDAYHEMKACPMPIDDPLTRKTFGIIEAALAGHNRQLARLCASLLSTLGAR